MSSLPCTGMTGALKKGRNFKSVRHSCMAVQLCRRATCRHKDSPLREKTHEPVPIAIPERRVVRGARPCRPPAPAVLFGE